MNKFTFVLKTTESRICLTARQQTFDSGPGGEHYRSLATVVYWGKADRLMYRPCSAHTLMYTFAHSYVSRTYMNAFRPYSDFPLYMNSVAFRDRRAAFCALPVAPGEKKRSLHSHKYFQEMPHESHRPSPRRIRCFPHGPTMCRTIQSLPKPLDSDWFVLHTSLPSIELSKLNYLTGAETRTSRPLSRLCGFRRFTCGAENPNGGEGVNTT